MQSPDEPRIVSQPEAELSKWEMSFDEQLIRIEHFLRGEKYNTENDKWERKRRPYMTEEGIQSVILMLDMNVNRNTFLTNYSIEDVRIRCMFITYNIIQFISENYDRYKIDFQDFDDILNIVNSTDNAFHRAIGGLEREQRLTSKKTVETIGNMRTLEKKGGVLSFLNPFSRRKDVSKYG